MHLVKYGMKISAPNALACLILMNRNRTQQHALPSDAARVVQDILTYQWLVNVVEIVCQIIVIITATSMLLDKLGVMDLVPRVNA